MIVELLLLVYEPYIVIAGAFMLFSAVVSGYSGVDIGWKEVQESIFWPVSLCVIFGVFMRIVVEALKKDSSEG